MSTLFYLEKGCASIEIAEKFSKKCEFCVFSAPAHAAGWKVAFFCAAWVRSMVPAWNSLSWSRIEQR